MDEPAARELAENTARDVLGVYAPPEGDLCLNGEFREDENIYIYYVREQLIERFNPGAFRKFAYGIVKTNGLVRLLYDYRDNPTRKEEYENEASILARDVWSKEQV